jgi:hypothetical protein
VETSARRVRVGVFFDDVAIRLVDGGAVAGLQTRDRGDSLAGLPASMPGTGFEEFTFLAPIPGHSGEGAQDGKAYPMIVYRLFLDSREYLN